VRIPDGTAAVYAGAFILGESQSLGETLGRPMKVWSPNHEGMSQKTYALVTPASARYGGVLCRRNTAAASFVDAAASIVLGGFL